MQQLSQSIGSTINDVKNFFVDLRNGGLSGMYSQLAFVGDELIGICLNYVTLVNTTNGEMKRCV
jgi:hypothetical protein